MKALLKSIIPPILLSAYRRLRYGRPPLPEWEYLPNGWPESRSDAGTGWEHESVAVAQRRKWPQFQRMIQAPAPFSVSHESPEPDPNCVGSQNAILGFAYAIARTPRNDNRLSMLDVGCGAGHYRSLLQQLFPEIRFDYTGFDLPHLCALGRELHPGATFVDREEAYLGKKFDFVLVSGSLQYSRDWKGTLRNLRRCTAGSLFVTRLPVALASPAYVIRQRAHAYGYETEYAGWVLNRNELLRSAEEVGLELVREFLLMDRILVAGAPEPVGHRGFLFRPAPR